MNLLNYFFPKSTIPTITYNKNNGTIVKNADTGATLQHVSKFKLNSPVKLNSKYINEWIFSHENWECFQSGKPENQFYSNVDYDQEIMLAMLMLMGEPVYGNIKGLGCDNDTFLCYFAHAGLSHWGYFETKNLVLLD